MNEPVITISDWQDVDQAGECDVCDDYCALVYDKVIKVKLANYTTNMCSVALSRFLDELGPLQERWGHGVAGQRLQERLSEPQGRYKALDESQTPNCPSCSDRGATGPGVPMLWDLKLDKFVCPLCEIPRT